MFYWLYKTRIGGRCHSSTTDNSWDFYTNKTKQQLQPQTYCHLLGLEETLTVAYDFGETQACNYLFFFFFFRDDSAEILASVWQEEKKL